MWLEVCKYVLFKWWRHSASTYDTSSFGWENAFSQPKITNKGSQIYRTSSENRPLGPPWDPFWIHFGASWEASWAHAPKRLDFGGFGEGPGSPRRPIWLQLGGPRPSKIEARTWKNGCQNVTRFWHRFCGHSDLILERFLSDFLQEKYTKTVKACF